MNKVILMGRLVREPEVSTSTSGTTFGRFDIAVDRRFKKEGEPDADFFACVTFGKQADFVGNYLNIASKTPAATADPITPATLGPIACISRKLDGSVFLPSS